MGESFFFLSMGSALVAFIVTIMLIHLLVKILQSRGIQVWSDSPPSLDSQPTVLSEEDKKEIEKLRSSAVLRHLNKNTMTLNKDNMVVLTASTQEESDTSSMPFENEDIEMKNEQSLQVENTTMNDDEIQYSHICVPLPGEQNCDIGDNTNGNTALNELVVTRNVPNLCVICHEEYKTTEKVSWATNSSCTHVFHEECVVRWLTSLGWMKLKEQNEQENIKDEDKCLNYDLECPTCRGQFICKRKLTIKTTVKETTASTGEDRV